MIILIVVTIILTLTVIFMATRIRSMKIIMDSNMLRDEPNTTDKSQFNELEATKLKLEFVIKSLSANIWEYDIVSDTLWSNSPSSILSKGLSFENYIKRHHPNNEAQIREEFQKLISGQTQRLKLELQLSKDNGKYDWIEIHGVVSTYSADGSASKIVGLRHDIQHEAEYRQQLTDNKQQLEEYAILTDLAMSSGDIVVWEFNFKTNIFSSPDKKSFMHEGISKEIFMSALHPDDAAGIEEGLIDFTNGNNWVMRQVRINFPDRGLRWVNLTAVILSRDENGKVTKIAGIRRDITKELEMTSELIDLRNKAEESNSLKSAFLANMSHEIRTPLNAIVGFSNLIATADDQEQMHEYMKIIESNNDLLLQLINDILDLSKIEAGKLEFFMSEINVNEVLSQLEQMFTLRAKCGVKVIFDTPDSSNPYLISDTNRLVQVITNFLSNAVKFTPEGEIHLGYKSVEGGTYFYVRDSGKGIAPQNIPYVFARFAKFDSLVQGTGLGLSICQTIVERLGGEIGVESEDGKGTMFWFTVTNSLHVGSDEQPEQDVLFSNETCNIDCKILIAEDCPSNYKLYEHALKKYELIHAWDGQQAVELFAKHKPTLVIMDLRMPVMNGYDATEAIRKISNTTPIIAVTASVLSDEKQRIMEHGFTSFLPKPINLHDLNEMLSNHLGNTPVEIQN